MTSIDNALEALCAKTPGLRVEIELGQAGHTLLHLWAEGHKCITINEPPAGWPVIVTLHHAHPGEETNYAFCGDGHCPNKLRPDAVTDSTKLTRDEWERLRSQKTCSPIDTPAKLLALCESLLTHDETKRGCERVKRAARRRDIGKR